jgi:AcrR family transcriptional regulator
MTGPVRTRTRAEILTAAAARFAAVGFKGTSLQDIAHDVGCSKATLLYHFATKDALLFELIAPPAAAVEQMDQRLSGLAGAELQEAAVEAFVDLAVRFREDLTMLHAEIPGLLKQPQFSDLQQILERLIAALTGRSGEARARVAALVVVAGVSGSCAQLSDLSDDELRAALLPVARRALDLPAAAPA